MTSAKDVATYLLQLDKENTVFGNDSFIKRNGRELVESSGKLNKFLHLAQNIYYAKTSSLLFPEKLYAFDNGGVVEEVRKIFFILKRGKNRATPDIPDDVKIFLRKLFFVLENATIDDLIKLSHQDPEWEEKHGRYAKKDQAMDTKSRLQDYKELYADVIQLMEGIAV